jgi:hypothetical protein
MIQPKTIYGMMCQVGMCDVGKSLHRKTKTFAEMASICSRTDEGAIWFLRKRYAFGSYMTPMQRVKWEGLQAAARVFCCTSSLNNNQDTVRRYAQAIDRAGVRTRMCKKGD